VPELRGLSEADGISLLIDAGLAPGRRIDRANRDIAAGAIVRTDPAGGAAVPPGSVIDYVLSRGPDPTPQAELAVVPDLRGLPLDEARDRADRAGLALDVRYQETRDATPETVLSQDPEPGTPANAGGTIRVVVARASAMTPVPRIRGLAEVDAIAVLLDAGLQPGTRTERYHEDFSAGLVLSSQPRPGTEVEPGSAVDYTVSLGPDPGSQPIPVSPPETPAATPGIIVDPGTGDGPDPGVATGLDGIVQQVSAIRELDLLAAVPVDSTTPRQLRRELGAWYDALNPSSAVATEATTLKRLGLLPQDADLRELTLSLLESGVTARYGPESGTLAVAGRDAATDPARLTDVAREAAHALQDQHWDLDGFRITDPSQADRALAHRAIEAGDAVAVSLDWAGQTLSGAGQAMIGSGLTPTDEALLDSMPLWIRRQFLFPVEAGLPFVDALRSAGGWDAVNAAWRRPPASTEQILHPERYPSDKPVKLEMPDMSSLLGGGWAVADERTLGELGVGVWLDDGQDGSPAAWAADGWGGDRLVRLEGPDGAWVVVWQTAWDSDGDADEFTGAADAAMADLPDAHAVVRGGDVTGGTRSPSLVVIASDQAIVDAFVGALGLGA